MDTNPSSCSHADDDDDKVYISMDVISFSNCICYSINSSSQGRELEFQLSSLSHDRHAGPDDIFFEWSTETIEDHPNKKCCSTKKLKQSLLGQKLKALRAYLKSLFTKRSGVFTCAKAEAVSTTLKITTKNPCKKSMECHSSATKSSTTLSGSSPFSYASSKESYDLQLVKRCLSDITEYESSIAAAIAHCKQSQQTAIVY